VVEVENVTDTQTTKTSLEPIPPLDLKAQWLSIKGEISAAINAVVESQQFILGPQFTPSKKKLPNIAALDSPAESTPALMPYCSLFTPPV
jgi:hypothetical protein